MLILSHSALTATHLERHQVGVCVGVCSAQSVEVAIYTEAAEPTGMCRIPLSIILLTGALHQKPRPNKSN